MDLHKTIKFGKIEKQKSKFANVSDEIDLKSQKYSLDEEWNVSEKSSDEQLQLSSQKGDEKPKLIKSKTLH